MEELFSYQPIQIGLLIPNCKIHFERAPDALLKLTRIINNVVNFEATNIIDLAFKQELITSSRRALTNGSFSRELIQGSGIGRIRGILMYGPAGSGKSSTAIKFGKMLSAVKTDIFNCVNLADLLGKLEKENF